MRLSAIFAAFFLYFTQANAIPPPLIDYQCTGLGKILAVNESSQTIDMVGQDFRPNGQKKEYKYYTGELVTNPEIINCGLGYNDSSEKVELPKFEKSQIIKFKTGSDRISKSSTITPLEKDQLVEFTLIRYTGGQESIVDSMKLFEINYDLKQVSKFNKKKLSAKGKPVDATDSYIGCSGFAKYVGMKQVWGTQEFTETDPALGEKCISEATRQFDNCNQIRRELSGSGWSQEYIERHKKGCIEDRDKGVAECKKIYEPRQSKLLRLEDTFITEPEMVKCTQAPISDFSRPITGISAYLPDTVNADWQHHVDNMKGKLIQFSIHSSLLGNGYMDKTLVKFSGDKFSLPAKSMLSVFPFIYNPDKIIELQNTKVPSETPPNPR